MPEIVIRLNSDRARDLQLLLLAGGYHVAPRSDAQMHDRLEYEVATEILAQLKRQGI